MQAKHRASRPLAFVLSVCCGVSACESPVSGEIADDSQALALQTESEGASDLSCSAEDFSDETIDIPTGSLFSTAERSTPIRCLRFLTDESLTADGSIRIVDVRHDAVDVKSSELAIPLYEIRTKSFLRGQRIAIRSNGKRFAEIEKACGEIKASGVADVFAVLPENQNSTNNELGAPDSITAIKPREFIAERGIGVWYVAGLSIDEFQREPAFSGLKTGLPPAPRDTDAAPGLSRVLLVERRQEIDQSLNFKGSRVFRLEGGLQALQDYVSKSEAMLAAKQNPRLGQRGCRS